MPIRQIIQASPETLSDMLLAAEDRYQDAEELLAQRRFDGCVYLLGFAAEMWLKAVCMRLRALGPAAPVLPALAALRGVMRQIAPAVSFANYHDLSFYVGCIEVLRSQQGRPLTSNIQSELHSKMVGDFYDEWIVDMRYRRLGLIEQQAWQSLESAWWIKSNWVQLV
jgi:hypothetical protein